MSTYLDPCCPSSCIITLLNRYNNNLLLRGFSSALRILLRISCTGLNDSRRLPLRCVVIQDVFGLVSTTQSSALIAVVVTVPKSLVREHLIIFILMKRLRSCHTSLTGLVDTRIVPMVRQSFPLFECIPGVVCSCTND